MLSFINLKKKKSISVCVSVCQWTSIKRKKKDESKKKRSVQLDSQVEIAVSNTSIYFLLNFKANEVKIITLQKVIFPQILREV